MIALGSTLLVFAAVLIALGAVTWPPGGLLFALPYLFLMPGVVLAVLGGMLLFIWRSAKASGKQPPDGCGLTGCALRLRPTS
jgi:hypothetical protein